MQGKIMQLTSAVILCLVLFGQSVVAKPGYASGYDVDYYVSVESDCFISHLKGNRQTKKDMCVFCCC